MTRDRWTESYTRIACLTNYLAASKSFSRTCKTCKRNLFMPNNVFHKIKDLFWNWWHVWHQSKNLKIQLIFLSTVPMYDTMNINVRTVLFVLLKLWLKKRKQLIYICNQQFSARMKTKTLLLMNNISCFLAMK